MRDYARLQTAILLRRFAYEVGHTARSTSAEAIHDLRVSIRRLTVCLRVFRGFYPGHSGKRIRQRLEDLMDLAGRIRNLDIALELLEQAGVPQRTALAARVREERRRAANRLSREVRHWKGRGFSRKWRSRLEL